MDKLTRYRTLIKQFLSEQADLMRSHPVVGLETICILDENSDQYMLLNVGWENDQRTRYTTLHVRIHNDKIWIEEDWTEEGITRALVEAGVPKEEIVLAFQSPEMRPLTDYAVA